MASSVAVLAAVAGCGSGGGGEAGLPVARVQGYVVSSFGYVFPEDVGGGCPGGFNRGAIEMRLDGETPIADDCNEPEANVDPGFKTFDAPATVAVADLDGIDSRRGDPVAGECPHDDFRASSGEPGADYQLWRALGCIRGFQKDEIADIVVESAVRNGSMTILFEAFDIDDESADGDVAVQAFASTEAPPTGPDGEVLPFATLGVHADPAYHSEVGRGRMEDGVITAGPMDIRLRLNIQIVEGDLTFRDAIVRLETHPDGTASGVILGYQSIDEVYEIFGRQAGRAGAEALSYTCSGFWEALQSQADGDFDAQTGACSSISVAYRFDAVPAFVVR